MVERWKELCNVKGHYTHLKFLSPPSPDKVSEEYTRVLSGTLGYASKLVRLEGTMLYPIKLHLTGEHFLDQLAQRVEQDNGAEQLGSRVGWFAQFWDDNQEGLFEMSQPVANLDARLRQAQE